MNDDEIRVLVEGDELDGLLTAVADALSDEQYLRPARLLLRVADWLEGESEHPRGEWGAERLRRIAHDMDSRPGDWI